MGIQDLWTFTLSKFPEVGEKADLTQIARKHADELAKLCGASGPGIDGAQSSLRLVIDADDCLDRLYGGYFNDWICGGSWNRMTTFMQELTTGLHNAGIMVTPIFNGASEPMHLHEWHKRQLAVRKRLTPLFRQLHQQQHRVSVAAVAVSDSGNRHAARISKHLWVSPSCLELSLRMAFRQLRLSTVCTMDDHRREVIDYCRENRFHGILADSAAYMIFQPPSLYSAGSMKLKFSGRIEVLRINVDKMARCLDLNPNRFCLFAALLGNHILTEDDLKDFYTSLLDIDSSNILIELVIEEVLSFVRKLESTDLVDSIGNLIFRNRPSQVKESLMRKLKDSYQYYANGTQEGFDRFKSKLKGNFHQRLPGSYPHASEDSSESASSPSKVDTKDDTPSEVDGRTSNGHPESQETVTDTSITADSLSSPPPPSIVIDSPSHAAASKRSNEKLATTANEESEEDQNKSTSNPMADRSEESTGGTKGREDPDSQTDAAAAEDNQEIEKETKIESSDPSVSSQAESQPQSQSQSQLLLPFSYSSSSSSSSSSGGSPARLSPDTAAPPTTTPSVTSSGTTSVTNQTTSSSQSQSGNTTEKRRTGHPSGGSGANCSSCTSRLTLFTSHQVAHQIIRETSERHQKGIMHPWIYQVLVEGEVKISIGLEDEDNKDIPLSVDLFRPIRQHVYAVLFDVRKPCPGDAAPTNTPTTNGKNNTHNVSRNGDSPSETSSQGVKEVFIKEWVVRKHNGLQCEPVKARPFEWKSSVPSCMQLWYGTQAEDKNRRMRAFLSCMGNDMAPLLLDTSMVPPQYLMMCCVLRYMVMERRILRRYELDAFLAQAVSPLLHHVDALMSLQLPELSPRGVHLATVFMKGVEHAILANDACGAPIPWTMTCPWLYFDGKLFHFKFIMATNGAGVVELCDHRPEQVMLVERLRNALFEGLTSVEFAHGGGQANMPGPFNPFFSRPSGTFHGGPAPFPASRFATPPPPPSGNPPGNKGVHRGGNGAGGSGPLANNRGGKAAVDYRGGKLEVGGIVVSNWGPNMAVAGGGGRGRAIPCPPMMRPPPSRNPMHPGAGGGNMMSGAPRFPPGGPAGFWPPGGPPAPFFPPGPNFGPFPGSGPPHRFPGPAGIHGMGRGGGMIGRGAASGWRKGRGRGDGKRGGMSNNSHKAVTFKDGEGSGSCGSSNGSPDKPSKSPEMVDDVDQSLKNEESDVPYVDGNGSKTATP